MKKAKTKSPKNEGGGGRFPRMEFTDRYIWVIQQDGTEVFPLTPDGLQQSYQFLSRLLGVDVEEEEEYSPFRRASRPIIGVNHK